MIKISLPYSLDFSFNKDNNYSQMAYKKPAKGYGYGKMSMWQWVLIYLVVGAVIYGLVYYFFFYNKVGGYPY
jgi:hypothetical protein